MMDRFSISGCIYQCSHDILEMSIKDITKSQEASAKHPPFGTCSVDGCVFVYC